MEKRENLAAFGSSLYSNMGKNTVQRNKNFKWLTKIVLLLERRTENIWSEVCLSNWTVT